MMTLSSPVYALQEALQKSGCPVCRLCHDAAAHYVDSVLYEYVNDPDVRAEWVAAGGLCRRHAETCRRSHNALGVAILFESLVRDALQGIDGPAATTVLLRSRIAGWFSKPGPDGATPACLACAKELEIERESIDALLSGLRDEVLQDVFAASSGLCMAHFHRAREACHSDAISQAVANCQREALTRLVSRLDIFIEKQDYQRSDEELTRDEGTSRLLAIDLMAPESRL